MCGILGIAVRQGRSVGSRDDFLAALATLSRRGPDQAGVYMDRRVCLGNSRLAIQDLTAAGALPMANETGSVILAFNGEIYNASELRAALPGHAAWRSRSDAEALLRGYEACGEGIVERLEAMFAFAVYDRDRQRLWLGRDAFGEKPLYYYADSHVFAFASEPKSLLALPALRDRMEIDEESVQKFVLYGYVPSPGSIFRGMRKLLPGTTLTFDLAQWRTVRETRFGPLHNLAPVSGPAPGEAEACERIDALVRQAVERRMDADVPLGIFLSGGVDSSLVAACVARHRGAVEAFHVGYAGDAGADERVHAQAVADSLGIRCHTHMFEGESVRRHFTGMLDYLDEPLADAAIAPLAFLAAAARERIVVAMGGDGGDELFGGYTKYRVQSCLARTEGLHGLATLASGLFRRGSPERRLLRCAALPFAVRQFMYNTGAPLIDEATQLLRGRLLPLEKIFAEAFEWHGRVRALDPVNRSLALDCAIQLPDWYLAKCDRATMAHGLELRSPLLDAALARYAFSLPGHMKIARGESKRLLKLVAARHVPHHCVYRRKCGFGAPIAEWIRTDLSALFTEWLHADNPRLDAAVVRRLHQEHLARTHDHSFTLLRVCVLNRFLARWQHWTQPERGAGMVLPAESQQQLSGRAITTVRTHRTGAITGNEPADRRKPARRPATGKAQPADVGPTIV